MTVHNLTLVPPLAPESALSRFHRLRRDCNLAMLAWLQERPAPCDVSNEIAASINTLRQLTELAGA